MQRPAHRQRAGLQTLSPNGLGLHLCQLQLGQLLARLLGLALQACHMLAGLLQQRCAVGQGRGQHNGGCIGLCWRWQLGAALLPLLGLLRAVVGLDLLQGQLLRAGLQLRAALLPLLPFLLAGLQPGVGIGRCGQLQAQRSEAGLQCGLSRIDEGLQVLGHLGQALLLRAVVLLALLQLCLLVLGVLPCLCRCMGGIFGALAAVFTSLRRRQGLL